MVLGEYMSKYLNSELLERLFFTMIVIGILASAIGAIRYFDLSNQIANNAAAQIRAEGTEVSVENTNEGYSLMTSDLELRRLIRDRSNMIMVGGVGLALIGAGWLLTDLTRSRRKKDADAPTQSVAEASST